MCLCATSFVCLQEGNLSNTNLASWQVMMLFSIGGCLIIYHHLFLGLMGVSPFVNLSIFQPALKALNYHHGSPYNSCRKDLRKPSSGWRVGSFWDVGSHHWGNAPRLWQTILSMAIGGHFRILDWRYLPYIREYPHKIWSYLSIDLIYLGSTSINCTCSHRSPAFKLNLGFQILHPTGSWRVSTVSWSNYSCR